MNRVFDYNGSHVSPSKPVKTLKTVKKHLMVDSADRDTTKFFTNGDFVVYLPRVYENVVSLRLMGAEFPLMVKSAFSPGAITHSVSDGQNLSKTVWTGDIPITTTPFYLLVEIEGFNKTDECAINGNRSGFSNSYYAKVPVDQFGTTQYNDHSAQENVAHLSPAIGKLDRLHIRTRLHTQQGSNEGFLYWTNNGAYAGFVPENEKGAEFSLSFEIEYLDNVFDDFSSIETRVSERG